MRTLVFQDLDLSKFLVTCGNTYFPGLTDLNMNFKMGVALEGELLFEMIFRTKTLPSPAVYKIISGWFDPQQAKITKMVNRSNIQDYINKDQLLPHMIKEK
jgi:hypothetical protein